MALPPAKPAQKSISIILYLFILTLTLIPAIALAFIPRDEPDWTSQLLNGSWIYFFSTPIKFIGLAAFFAQLLETHRSRALRTSSLSVPGLRRQALIFMLVGISFLWRVAPPRHHGGTLQVTVEVDGKPLKEYEDRGRTDGAASIVPYIEAETNKTFSIKATIPKGFSMAGEGLHLRCVIDGEVLASSMMEWADCRKWDDHRVFRGCQTEQAQLRMFKFAGIDTICDVRQTEEEVRLVERLGTIRLVVCCIKDIKLSARSSSSRVGPKDIGAISEKALKGEALSHSVCLGEPIESRLGCKQYTFSYLTVDDNGVSVPIATYEFRYRSLAALKDLMTIERTPPPPSLEDRDFESLSREELKELHNQARANNARPIEKEALAEKIKREREDDNPRPRKVRRPAAGGTQLEIDGAGSFRETSVAGPLAREIEVIELN
ncbi:hypothetical protein Slin14017_G094650 [Septoria linicola]|nr:hypothetical protein Slin14017_G094650 [Septoria linicola]